MTHFVHGGGEEHLAGLRAAHLDRMSKLREQLQQATTRDAQKDIRSEIAKEKRAYRAQVAAAKRSMY